VVSAHSKRFGRDPLHESDISAYMNTTIKLDTAVPGWGLRPTRIIRSSADNATTADGGRTWFIKEIRLRQSVAPDEYTKG
jgi:hypothetical protein